MAKVHRTGCHSTLGGQYRFSLLSLYFEALRARVEHCVFGYGSSPTNLTELFIQRMRERYQWEVKAQWLVFLPGLVSGLHLAVREQRLSLMRRDADRWCVNFSGTDTALTGNERLLVLCNPHNPGGSASCREELLQHLAFAPEYDLLVCSDEIHCDLLLTPGLRRILFASLDENAAQHSITLMSPTKNFNIAGLGASVAVIPNARLHMKFAALRASLVPAVDVC